MEYRRRKKRRYSRGRTASSGASYSSYKKRRPSSAEQGAGVLGVIMPIAAFAAVIWLLAGTGLGDRLAERSKQSGGGLLSGCAKHEAINEHGSSIPSETTVVIKPTEVPLALRDDSIKVSLPAMDVYMLQMGVYSSAENAAEQSAALKKRGAAGFVYDDNGSYRAIAAAYSDKASAESVQSRLENEGYECTVFHAECSGAELLITAETEMLAGIRAAFEFAGNLSDELDKASIEYDEKQQDIMQAQTTLRDLALRVKAAGDGVYESARSNELLMYVYSYLSDMERKISSLCNYEYDSVGFSSALKELRIVSSLRYAELLKQIGA